MRGQMCVWGCALACVSIDWCAEAQEHNHTLPDIIFHFQSWWIDFCIWSLLPQRGGSRSSLRCVCVFLSVCSCVLCSQQSICLYEAKTPPSQPWRPVCGDPSSFCSVKTCSWAVNCVCLCPCKSFKGKVCKYFSSNLPTRVVFSYFYYTLVTTGMQMVAGSDT